MNKQIMVAGLAALMLLSTIAFASSFILPAPFSTAGTNGTSGSIIVIGSENDRQAAEVIQDSLEVSSDGVGAGAFQFERSSNRLNLGESLTQIQSQIIDESELTDLLAEGEYSSGAGDTFDYSQEIRLSTNLNFTVFQDSDLNDNAPTIGVRIPQGDSVLNYTIDFTEQPDSEIDGTSLVDFEDTEIELLGSTYRIIEADDDDRFVLTAGAVDDQLDMDETKSYQLEGNTYEITLNFVDPDEAIVTINGRRFSSLQEGESLSVDANTEFVLTDILYQQRDGGIERIGFLLGANTLVLEDGEEIEMNGETVDNVFSYISSTTSGDTYTLEDITIEWIADEDLFVAESGVEEENRAIMPGFRNVEIFMTGFETSDEEELEIVNSGDSELVLEVVLAGDTDAFTLPLLATTNGNAFTNIGGEGASEGLVTSDNATVVWDDDTDQYLVASWTNGDIAESYVLEIETDSDNGVDVIDITNAVTGNTEEENVEVGEVVFIGDLDLTVEDIDTTTNTATLRIGSGGSFNLLYTAEGLQMELPVDGDNIDLGTDATWNLVLTEQDSNEDIGAGTSFTIPLRVDTTNDEVEVGSITNTTMFAGGIFAETEDDSDVSVGWIASELASRIEVDSSADQSSATVFYHGEESFGNVFLGRMGDEDEIATRTVPIVRMTSMSESALENMHIIAVGGSCVNPVSARILSTAYPSCGENFEDDTGVGAGEFIIQTSDSPFTGGRIATVVAGYEAADTLAASREFADLDEINVGDDSIGQTAAPRNRTNSTG